MLIHPDQRVTELAIEPQPGMQVASDGVVLVVGTSTVAGSLYVIDLATGSTETLPVRLAGSLLVDRSARRLAFQALAGDEPRQEQLWAGAFPRLAATPTEF